MKILFLFPYPSSTAGSQRFRFEQYLDFLTEKGFSYHLASFWDENTWEILYKSGHGFQKIAGILSGFFKRFLLLFSVSKYDFVFIHREATPLGPPIIEFLIAKVFRKKIIFDFDDAIWLPNTSQENKIAGFLKFSSKTRFICQWSYKISAGNRFLATWAGNNKQSAKVKMQMVENQPFSNKIIKQLNSPLILINPTTLDTENYHNRLKNQETETFVIGWTGTHSTLSYLLDLLPVIRKLEKKYEFTFLVISNKNPDFDLTSFRFVPWQKETEIEDLLRMNIGVMPLTDDEWARGKCGFKALQYMALGIPALVSPVGVNVEIVQNQENGFICQTPEEWENIIEFLLTNPAVREKLGRNARKTVEESYSIRANQQNFLSLFQ